MIGDMNLFHLRTRIRKTSQWIDLRRAQLCRRLFRPNLYRLGNTERVGIVFMNPSEMTVPERMFLYSIIRGSRPRRCLEIGTRHGGSAAIITAALEDNGKGQLVGLDPAPAITLSKRYFHGRFTQLKAASPEAVPEASSTLGGSFDFILIDGIHIYKQAKIDFEACLPYLSSSGYLLFHDAFHYGVAEAIREVVEANLNLHDCGYVCTQPTTKRSYLAYGGFRMIRIGSPTVADPQPLLDDAYAVESRPAPVFNADLLNHDGWYCRTFEKCAWCRKQEVASKNNHAKESNLGESGSE